MSKLAELRGWIEHIRADVKAGLTPYDTSFDEALRLIDGLGAEALPSSPSGLETGDAARNTFGLVKSAHAEAPEFQRVAA